MSNPYKIELGIGLRPQDFNNIKADIKSLEDKPIRLKIDTETKELTKSIQDALKTLSKGGQNAFTINVTDFNESIKGIKAVVVDLKKTLGTLGDNVNMKKLLSSVNQIANAIGKVTDESESLSKSLSALSKKDFGFNIGVKLGGNSVTNNAKYGDFARDVISKFELQAKQIDKAIKEQYSKIGKRLALKANDYSGSAIDQLMIDAFGYNNYDEYTSKFNGMYDKKNMSNQLAGWKNYFNLIEDAAQKMGVNLSSTMDGFSADKYVREANEIRSGTKETADQMQTLKSVIGGGIGAEQLSTQLEPIVDDLHSIQEAITALSKDTSLGDLTSSFNRLSESIENLLANAEKVKGVLNSGFGGSVSINTDATNKIENVSDKVTNDVVQNEKKKQEAYKETSKQLDILKQKALNYTDVKQFIRDNAKDMKTVGIKNSKAATQLWKDANYEKGLRLVEMSLEDACDVIRTKLPKNISNGWFREANSDYKSKIENFALTDDELKNAALNIAWNNFKNFSGKNISLQDFAYSDIPVYRGKNSENYVNGDDILSFTFDKSVAEKFGKHVVETMIKPIETIGAYQTTGESEIFVRRNQLENRQEYIKWHEDMSEKSVVQAEERKQQAYQETTRELSELQKYYKKYYSDSSDKSNDARVKFTQDRIVKQLTNPYNGSTGIMRKITQFTDPSGISQKDLDYFSAVNAELKKIGYTLGEIQWDKNSYNASADIIPIDDNAIQSAEEMRNILYGLESQGEKVAQVSAQSANAVIQDEERKQQSYRETADAYEKISRDTSLVRDDADFQKVFEASNQAAQEAQKHFQELLADEKAVVSITEQFDDNNALQSFAVNIKRASGEVETLRYAMDKLNDEGDEGFAYQGGSSSDSRVEKQLEARIKKANDLQIKLDKIKSGYDDMGAAKPIKEEAHIKSLSDQYDKVQAAIESVKNADNSTYASMVSNAEKEKAALESLVQVYRSAETFSTDLRAKDRDTAKEVYSSRLDVLSSKMRKDGVYDGLKSDVGVLSTKISDASDVKALSEIANELTKLDAKYKSAKAAKDEFNRSQNVGSSVSGLKSDIEILQKASPSIKSFKTEINGTEVSIESLLKDLNQVNTKGDFDVIKGKVEAFGKAAEAAGIDLNEAKAEVKKLNDVYKQMLEIQKQIRSLSLKEKNLTELGNTNELNEVSTELKNLKSDYETLKRTFGGKLTSTQFGNLQAEIDETESELKQLDAKFADTRAKLANQIKIKISDTGFNGFEQEFKRAHIAAEELEGVYPDLEAALKRLDIAMEGVYSADQSGDIKRLVAANEEYENSLKQVYSQLKLYQQAEQNAYKAEMLQQKKSALSSEMEVWLKNNTKATKDFGEEIRRLQASLDGLDDKGVKLVGQQFKNVKRQAEVMGKTGLTVFDKLKSKVKEYASYLSAAELFMYAEQAFRSMFEAVKEIDTAMTGLYRVTDLTASQYDTLFNEMIGSAKEYGATLNDIINATTDWVRAGFDADTALGLAEVTTMYQHISDLDYDTAAENLITAYNGFKDELNGVFDGDTVGAVNYIADILNELDRHNCP